MDIKLITFCKIFKYILRYLLNTNLRTRINLVTWTVMERIRLNTTLIRGVVK
jgi:hypothetical protein